MRENSSWLLVKPKAPGAGAGRKKYSAAKNSSEHRAVSIERAGSDGSRLIARRSLLSLWKSCELGQLTALRQNRYFLKVSRTAGFAYADPAGLKTRRSGGNANRSLTTWLNVPVVRFLCFWKRRYGVPKADFGLRWGVNVRVKSERSHKIS